MLATRCKRNHILIPATRTASGQCRACKNERSQEAREKAQAIIREAKAVPCADCGGRWPHYVMQFDHVRGIKKFIVSRAHCGGRYSLRALREEIDKCDVVCANCHSLRHPPELQKNSLTL